MIRRAVRFFLKTVRYLASFVFPNKIEERKSAVSDRLEVHYRNGKYVLDTANVNYSFGGLHAVFQKAFSQFHIRQRDIKKVLILGFGSGSVASILKFEYGKEVTITGVEKDPAVIALAEKYFSIEQYKNLSLHCADAHDFMLNPLPASFDLVVVDLFVGLNVPGKFQDEEFISALNGCLSENGILFYNFIARDERTRDAGGKLYKRMDRLISKTEWIRIFGSSTENWVFVCDKIKKS